MPTDTFFNLANSKKEKIEKYSIKEFANYGYTKASINRIIKDAQISRGSFYSYFLDKDDLYLYLITKYFDITQEVNQQDFNNLNYFDYQYELFNILLSKGANNPKWMKKFLTDSTVKQMNIFWQHIRSQSNITKKQLSNLRFVSNNDLQQINYITNQIIWKSLDEYFIKQENIEVIKQKIQKQLLFLKIGIQK